MKEMYLENGGSYLPEGKIDEADLDPVYTSDEEEVFDWPKNQITDKK